MAKDVGGIVCGVASTAINVRRMGVRPLARATAMAAGACLCLLYHMQTEDTRKKLFCEVTRHCGFSLCQCVVPSPESNPSGLFVCSERGQHALR